MFKMQKKINKMLWRANMILITYKVYKPGWLDACMTAIKVV